MNGSTTGTITQDLKPHKTTHKSIGCSSRLPTWRPNWPSIGRKTNGYISISNPLLSSSMQQGTSLMSHKTTPDKSRDSGTNAMNTRRLIKTLWMKFQDSKVSNLPDREKSRTKEKIMKGK